MAIRSVLVLSLVLCGVAKGTAQIRGIEAGSAEHLERLAAHRRGLLEEQRRYKEAYVVRASKLPKPSADEVAADIRIRGEQRDRIAGMVARELEKVKASTPLSDVARKKDPIAGALSRTTEERSERIAQLETLLARVTTGQPPIAPRMFADEMAIGQIGAIIRRDFEEQAIFEVFQIMSPTSMMVRRGRTNCWVDGIPTDKLIDGQDIRFGNVMHVVGNKTYQASLGTKTILRMVPYDPQPANKRLAARGE